MAYLVDEATGILRFAHDAGITDDRRRDWVRSLELQTRGRDVRPGRSPSGRVIVTGDYIERPDPSSTSPTRTGSSATSTIHSFVVAPLVTR